MRKFINLVALAALLFVPWATKAQNTLTVADGTATNSYVPVYGYYADANLRSQIVYPATDIAAATTTAGMTGASITGLTFYAEQSSVSLDGTWEIKMMEITSTTLSAFQDLSSATLVYSGMVGITNNQMVITFTTPYTYNGGNLLIDFSQTEESSSYPTTTFYGVDQSGASVQGYSYSGVSGISATARNFMPKTTFTFTGGAAVTCPAVQGLSITNLTSDGGTLHIVDTMNTGATYSINYWKPGGDTATVTSSTTDYTFTGLDANSLYYYTVTVVCSATDESVALGGSFATLCGGSTCDLTVSTNTAYYAPSVTLFQNGINLGSFSGSAQTVEVCSTDPIQVIYTEPSYSYYSSSATVTILDGGGTALYDGSTSSVSTGDTLLTISTPCPSCIPPTALFVDNVDQENITIGWTPRSDATLFSVYLDGQEMNGNVTDTFYTFTNLNANTAYTLGVQALCSSDDSSSIATLVARTECGVMTLPFSDDFDSYDNGFWPPCWHRLRAYGTDPSVNAQYHHSGTQSMFLLAANDTTLFCTPNAIPTAGDNIYVRYHAFLNWASYYNETKWIKAGVMTDTSDISTFVALDSVEYHNFNDVFEEREFNTSTLDPTETYWVAWMFYSTNNGYGSYNRGAIDDVYISEIPSCLRVTSIGVDSISSESITLTWVDGVNSGASYTVSYWTAVSDTNSVTTTDTSYLFTDLSANTQYFFSVQVNCGGEDAEAVTASFRTSCGATPIPFVEGFDDASSLTCWQMVNPVSMTGYNSSNGRTSNGCFLFYYTTNPPEYLISPELTDTENGLKLEFYYKRYSSSYEESFKVGYSTTSDSTSAFVWGEEVTDANESYQLYSTIMPAGVKYVAIQYTANDAFGLYIDDINFMLPPNCMPAYGLTVDNLTSTTATLHWSAPEGQSSFIVRLDSTDYNVSGDTSYTFTDLEARTGYTAYVGTDCGGDTAEFVPITFMTDCSAGSCEIIVTSTASYPYSNNYCPTVHVWQNGFDVASVNGSTDTISVCTGMPVALIYEEPMYSYYTPSVTIINGGDEEVFNSNTDNYSTGDTLILLNNACPSCVKPTGVMATSIDSSEINFAWNTDPAIEYLVSLDEEPYTTNNNGTVSYAGLTPNTVYTFSVRAVCAPGDTSNARVITVKTACGEMAIPFIEGFEGNADGDVPSCWNAVSGYAEVDIAASDAHTGNASLYMYGNDAMIATSRVPLPGDSIHVSFWADLNAGSLEAGVMTNLLFDTTFTSLLTINNTNGYELFEFNTSTLSYDNSYYVAFRFSSPYYSVNIDDINIRLDEGCMYPSNVVATPSATGVDLSWNYGGSVVDFAIEYRTLGSTVWSTPDNVNDSSYTLTGLNSSTSYEARVGTICGNDTLWTITTFQTNCLSQPLPYSEDFEAYANDVMPPCWIWSSTHCTHWDGGVFLRSNHGGGSEYVVLPQLDGNITKLKIEFDTKVGTPAENDGILIGVTDAAGTLLGWLDTIQDPLFSRNNHVRKTIYFPNYNIPIGAERVAFAQYRNWGEWALIDNINIEELPDCYPVDNLVGSNLNDIENTTFTWHPQGTATQWQVYVDTVTVGIDSLANLPDSLFINVYDTTYTIPIGMIQGGGIYNFFVRSACSAMDHSGWVKNEFGAGTIIMNNSSVADTIEGCGFVVYDNGGPIPGYLPNSNSALVLRTENVGSQLQIFGGKFGWGSSPATLTVYDGEGTNGAVLYTYNTVNGRDTLLNTVLATSTTGSLTITFTSNGNMCHTGYELYVRCTEGALCPRPTELQAEMTSETTADVTWSGTASNYNFYYRLSGAATWVRIPTTIPSVSLTGLLADTVYDMYVVAICSATDSSNASVTRQLISHYEIPVIPCDAPTSLMATDVTSNSAILSWTNGDNETLWTLDYNGTEINVNTNPYTLTGLTPNTTYVIKIKAVCDTNSSSAWSGNVAFTTLAGTPEVTYHTVIVLSNDSTMGSVNGGGTYAENSQAILNAIPNEGYHFVSWSNGATAASISITVTSDTILTATFAENDPGVTYYTVTLSSNNPSWGAVTGAGNYEAGSSVEIKAISNAGYHFVNWSDDNTDSIRTIVVNSDMNLTANFAQNVGIDDVNTANITLYPNPASGTVTLTGIEGMATVTVVDMNGRESGKWKVESGKLTIDLTGYAQGAYFIRIVGEQMNAIRKLIVK